VVVKHSDGTRPIDLASYYLTARLGIGQALTIGSIHRRLSLYPVNEVLECLAEICIRADHLPIRQPDKNIAFARWLFPRQSLRRAELALTDPHASPMSSQVAVNLALHALVACAPTGRPPDKPDLIRTLGGLCLALGDHLGRDRNDDDLSMTVEITRLGLFYTQNDLSSWLDLAHELFFEVMPSMTDDHDFVDCGGVVSDAYGINFERFWALTVVEGIAVSEAPGAIPLPQRVEGWNVTEEELAAWTTAWSSSIDDARAASRRDIDRATGWSFEAFADRPLIQLGGGDKLVAVRPAWIPSKATPAGMFWAVRHPFVAAGGSHSTWSQFMGRAVEELGRRLVARYLPHIKVVEESEIVTWGTGSNCDLMLLETGVLAIDFVFRQFTKESSGTGNFADLAADLRKAAVQKLHQIDKSLAKGIAGSHLPPGSLYPMVVIGGPFPVNPLLYDAVQSAFSAEPSEVLGHDVSARPFALIDMGSFLALLRVAQGLQIELSALLEGWLTSGMAKSSLRDWLTTDGPRLSDEIPELRWGSRAFALLGLPQPPLQQLGH